MITESGHENGHEIVKSSIHAIHRVRVEFSSLSLAIPRKPSKIKACGDFLCLL